MWWLVLVWLAVASNVGVALWNWRLSREYSRTRELLLLLCTDAWKAQPWPRQHIVFDDWPKPFEKRPPWSGPPI